MAQLYTASDSEAWPAKFPRRSIDSVAVSPRLSLSSFFPSLSLAFITLFIWMAYSNLRLTPYCWLEHSVFDRPHPLNPPHDCRSTAFIIANVLTRNGLLWVMRYETSNLIAHSGSFLRDVPRPATNFVPSIRLHYPIGRGNEGHYTGEDRERDKGECIRRKYLCAE